MIFEYSDVFEVETAMPIHGPSCFLHVQLGLGFAERVLHLAIPTIKSLNCQLPWLHKVKIDLKVILEYLYSCQFQ